MAIMAPTLDQVGMGVGMQRGAASVPLASPGNGVGDLASVPGFGRYWARSSWAGGAHLGAAEGARLGPPLGMSPFASGFAGLGPFSLGNLEPASGGASSRTAQPVLEAVEGATQASAVVEAAAAASHALAQVAQQQETANRSSCSDHLPGARSPGRDAAGPRKRKDLSPPDPKGESVRAKRSKEARGGDNRSSSEASTESGSPKASKGKTYSSKEHAKQDYIHVRARRGQATDSHSLAERVRREKISERMKYLQDLVPGCKKVTGKAVMLDEIINYVQSLQRQVEHLSMKLAFVNPAQSGLALERLASNKELLSSLLGGASEGVDMGLSGGHRLAGGFDLRALGGTHLDLVGAAPLAALADPMPGVPRSSFDTTTTTTTTISQPSSEWDGELQSVVQMGFHHQGRLGAFEGQLPVGHMKVEL